MAQIIEISDLSDAALDVYMKLTEAQLRNRLEPQLGLFIAESEKVIRVALNSGFQPVSMLMEHRHIEGQAKDLITRVGDIPIYTAPRDVLAQLTGYELTRGFLCAMRRPVLPTVEELCRNVHRVAVLEGIVDVTNIGAIFRSAAALHIDAVLLTPSCCDPLCRRAARVSMGTVCQIPWTRIGDKPSQWPEEGMERLHRLGFKTAAMALSSTAISVEDPRLKQEEKLAIILGTEGDGLSCSTIAGCDYTVCIPMSHNVDSLNVAAASAVSFWEMRYRK